MFLIISHSSNDSIYIEWIYFQISKPEKQLSTTPSGSLSFLHRLSFIKHSPAATPLSNYPEQYSETTLSRPTDLLFPVKELENIEDQDEEEKIEEQKIDDVSSTPVHEDQWYVPTGGNDKDLNESYDENVNTALQAMNENESTRDATIKELECFLNEFRSGKLKARKFYIR